MMASDWSAQVAAQPMGNKKGYDSFKQANSPDTRGGEPLDTRGKKVEQRTQQTSDIGQAHQLRAGIMLFYPSIGSTYFVKTQTYVALFGPHKLSIIFSGVMCLELSPL